MSTITIKKKNISKNQWLGVALDILESEGVENIKIKRLAKRLCVSRSGFYWHFKNRQELLQDLRNFWVLNYTDVVTNNSSLDKLNPNDRLLVIIKTIREKHLAKYDLAMFAWAKIDPLTKKVVEKVVNMRLDFIRVIFSELGFEGAELEMRTRLFVCYHSWEKTMFNNLPNSNKIQKLCYNFLIK